MPYKIYLPSLKVNPSTANGNKVTDIAQKGRQLWQAMFPLPWYSGQQKANPPICYNFPATLLIELRGQVRRLIIIPPNMKDNKLIYGFGQ
jgi:hypothetical protein